MEEKEKRNKRNHPLIRRLCSLKCKRNCKSFTEEERLEIWTRYWELPYVNRRKWLAKNVQLIKIKCRRSNVRSPNYRKNESRLFFFPKNNKSLQVCRTFFLNSLGYTNDSVITELSSAIKRGPLCDSVKENRGIHSKQKVNKELIKTHIESYNPCVSHYRRYNAPNIRYLPRNLSVSLMVRDFNQKNPNNKCGRETYRKTLKEMSISLNLPKSDSCADCSLYEIQKKEAERKGEALSEELVQTWELHKKRAEKASQKYREDKSRPEDKSLKICSMDLQKVLLLPVMPDIKDCFFTSRLVVFNETFAPLQPTCKSNSSSYCVVWHEGIADRSAQSIIDAIMTFMKYERDSSHFIFWADNCSAQNKNWYLFTALVVAVNTPDGPDEIKICYLTKGHTHMSADSVHGNIEKRIQGVRKIYDFDDLKEAMTTSRKKVKVVDVSEFRKWEKKKRQARKDDDILKSVKLADIVEVVFLRNSRNLKFKTEFDQEVYIEVDFLQKKFNVNCKPEVLGNSRGIKYRKKQTILEKLVPLMPENRREFWKNLTENHDSSDLQTDFE